MIKDHMRDHCVPDLVESWLGIMVSMVCKFSSSDSPGESNKIVVRLICVVIIWTRTLEKLANQISLVYIVVFNPAKPNILKLDVACIEISCLYYTCCMYFP